MSFRSTLVAAVSAASLLLLTVVPAWAAGATARDISDTCGSAPDGGFSDVSDENVHEDRIDCIKHYGITTGRTPTTYDPGGTLQMDELVTFLIRTMEAGGFDVGQPSQDWFDDDDGSFHEHNLNLGYDHAIWYGCRDRQACPDMVPTRAQMAHLVLRMLDAAGVADYDAVYDPANPLGVPDYFEDDDGIVHEPAINYVAHLGIVTGKTDDWFAPYESLQRGQMATFLARAIDAILDGGSR